MPTLSLVEGLCGVSGFILACGYNFAFRRPYYSGIHKHIILSSAGYLLGGEFDRWRLRIQHNKLMVLEDYMRRHPEDFEEQPKKKYKDVLYAWEPCR